MDDRADYQVTHLRADSLAMGVLLAYFYHFKPQLLSRVAQHRWLLIFFGLALLSPMAVLEISRYPMIWTIGFTMLYVGYGCILVAFVHTPAGPAGGVLGRFFGSVYAKVLGTIGFYSYGMYLWHLQLVRHPMQILIAQTTFADFDRTFHWALWTGFYVAAVFTVGAALSRLIEIPALAVRDRVFPTRTAEGATSRR
jgi:peptidoglycan/LPS O-acetylase OafA/YrhL